MEIATRNSWKTVEMPEQNILTDFGMSLSASEYLILRAGSIPREMEDKWFIFAEGSKLYFHRSWTGFCIFVADVLPAGDGYLLPTLTINRDPNQYTEKDLNRSKELLTALIQFKIRRKVDVEALKALFNPE